MDWGRGEYERTAALLIPAAEAVIRAAELRPGGSAVDVGLRHGAPLRCLRERRNTRQRLDLGTGTVTVTSHAIHMTIRFTE